MSVPIAMTTYVPEFSPQRTRYLRQSVESLEASGEDVSGLRIYDDHSENPEHLALLDELAKKYYVERREERLGAFLNCRLAISDSINGNERVVYLQDDIKASKGWLRKGIKWMDTIQGTEFDSLTRKPIPEIAILSLFNFDKKMPDEVSWTWLNYGHPGAVAWIVDTELWTRYCERWPVGVEGNLHPMGHKHKDHRRLHLADWKICHCMNVMQIYQAVLKKSLIDHMGSHSSCVKANMEHTTKVHNYVER